MIAIKHIEGNTFQLTFTAEALAALHKEADTGGEHPIPESAALRIILAQGLGLSNAEAADDPQADLDDGMPF